MAEVIGWRFYYLKMDIFLYLIKSLSVKLIPADLSVADKDREAPHFFKALHFKLW
ncbi:hypothetical protein ID856_11455 [Xenorhabdus sp. 18]|uniref:hypothetical protein n=1 Tax=Xenorhabdus doucetiae TaxID=351671 RepID=UPI0019CCBE00|nr:hypothetical protein [Xenorhabdus sp. 18]MBD2797150.1 hypothetical protein [Xenorhabdus sp. 18]